MACHRVSRAVMTARFSQASRISAWVPKGWTEMTAKPPSPSMVMWSPRVSWLVSLTAGRQHGVRAAGHDTGTLAWPAAGVRPGG